MNLAKTLVILSAGLLVGQAALGGVLSPGLEAQIANLRGDEEIKVLVVLADQADIASLNQDLRASKTGRQVRHQTVIDALQDAARRSQDGLLGDLDTRQRAGDIAGFTPHWLVNAVVVRGTVDAIRAIAARSDVVMVEPDLVVEPILPVEGGKPAARADNRGIGITPGVVNIGARRVWDELGIDGTGVVVGILDTGVDGNHPALAARWRGLFADPAECWLDAANLGDPNFPVDRHYHGTHVMGTVTGQAADDTIGVAPGALWIATNVINMSTGSAFDNAVIASLEFMADPDGNPGTTDDVPCVVQNSWGVNENFSGYFDCDSRWWAAIDNCEAAGVCLTWSAGNEGPGGTTLRSPADRADTPYNCFSVGSTIATPPFTISSFSSRGPSGCGGPYATKPEVSAPGSDIYSAQPGGGYQNLSGTSMAGPHVAGVVALMCAANPDLDVDTIKQVLMDTAVDLGSGGEDNVYGHGFVDAYEAVLAVMSGFGTVEGTVTDAGNGQPIEGVLVTVSGQPYATETDAAGQFTMMLPAGTHTLNYEAFGYAADSQPVTVPEDGLVDGSIALSALPTAVLSGTVYDYTGAVVAAATVTALDTPVPPAVSDASGAYSLTLPEGVVYEVVARAAGFGADQQLVDLQGNTTRDFTLPELTAEDFESGDFLQYPWEMSGNADWIVDGTTPYEGNFSARSGDIGDGQTSTLAVTLQTTVDEDIRFWYRVSSESTYDYLRFYVDGTQVQSWSGEIGWTQFSTPVTAGEHVFTWSYTKDGSVSSGSDAGWVDFIEFPAVGEIPQPELVFGTTSLEVTLAPSETHDEPLTVGNVGVGALDFAFTVQFDPAALPAPVPDPYHELPKGADDVDFGMPPILDEGGPDGFGYLWKDSNEPSGPVYGWVDISGVGNVAGTGDDSSFGPFPLGFSFAFYGQLYDEVRICTNGFLSFTSSSTAYSNASIPNTSEPNALVAPLWDDLNPGSGGTIYYHADAAGGRFVVQYEGVHHYPSGDPETFEVILNADGSILFQYATVASGASCTVGIENPAGDDGLEVVYNAAYLTSGLAIRLALDPGLNWLTVNPIAGTVAPGGQAAVDATFDATDLAVGTYLANLILGTNDPLTPQVTVPVTLHVTDAVAVGRDLPDVVVLHGAAPNPFNPMTTLSFSLPRSGPADLRIYDVQGRLVKTLMKEVRSAGTTEVNWNGTDMTGRGVASGTYFAHLRADGQQQVISLVLVR